MFGNTKDIRSQVMKVIDEKIKNAQARLDADIKTLEEKLEQDKEAALSKAVQSIVGKIL